MQDTITADITLRLLIASDDAVPVPVTVTYCQQDSYAITADFFAVGHEHPQRWVFARDLLANGLLDYAGACDVKIKREGSVVLIKLESPEGTALLEANHAELDDFLGRTYRMVPAGTETFDTDALIAQIMEQS